MSFDLDLKEGIFPIIIKPNLGQPILLNLRDFKDENGKLVKNILFDAIIIAHPHHKSQDILNYFHLRTYIQPILSGHGEFQDRRGEKSPLLRRKVRKVRAGGTQGKGRGDHGLFRTAHQPADERLHGGGER